MPLPRLAADDYDVVVVGGGSAGIAAVVGAAATGASVCLVEQYGFLGGAATNSSVLTHCGFFDQTGSQVVKGVGQQVLDKLAARTVYRTMLVPETGNTIVLLDMETIKVVFDELLTETGVRVLLHSTLVGTETDGNRLSAALIAHRGGPARITGRAFVDCSGDGALSAASGAATLISEVGERQPATLVMRVGGVPEQVEVSASAIATAVQTYRAAEPAIGADLVRSSGIAVRLPVSREIMLLLVDQHRDVLDVDELTRAEVEARRLSWLYLAAFRRFLPGWQDAFLSATGPQIGIREARRLHGIEQVSALDVSSGRKRPQDAIARCGWPMENHVAPGVTEYGGIKDHGWYHIPFGAIRSSSLDNLLAGGRLVSSDNRAYASLRVMGTSFATGHACGVAAAGYARSGRHDYAAVRRELDNQGALI